MSALDTPSAQSPSSSRDASRQFSAVRLPIEERGDDIEETVEKLQACSTTDLRRARQHHRRAIESLQEGGYNALSETTRNQLLARLRRNLEALNRALDTTAPSTGTSAPPETEKKDRSFIARVRAFFQGHW